MGMTCLQREHDAETTLESKKKLSMMMLVWSLKVYGLIFRSPEVLEDDDEEEGER